MLQESNDVLNSQCVPLVSNWYKKPVLVQTILWDNSNAVKQYMRLVGLNDFTVKDNGSVSINVKGSVINADIGEYIVKDENNEYYTCDVDTFEKAYVRFVGIGGAL